MTMERPIKPNTHEYFIVLLKNIERAISKIWRKRTPNWIVVLP